MGTKITSSENIRVLGYQLSLLRANAQLGEHLSGWGH